MQQIILDKNNLITEHLSSSDRQLALLIDLVGEYTLVLRTDYFASLVRSIIGQQLSVKAAGTIWRKTAAVCGNLTPENILTKNDEELRQAGLSRPKISYIKDLSHRVLNRELDFERLCHLEDEHVISALTGVRGIGKWTAEMFLIFSLGRLDVLSVDDVGLRRSVAWLYRLNKPPGAAEMQEYGERWKPYRTVASLYLWEAVNRGYVSGYSKKL